ncbi:beta-ketoacyl-[acyl-carrier-protein] synthase family protein [Nonomuraea sp. NPDC049158]|uniref:beta-ketoacyl-[acyl-carrier-protein] synthase family protein n=1 Tax=Nonomuraea sp. NPDC049158 TaxID=3155649 RepID=UPI0033CD195B
MDRRVVITGAGIVAPAGIGVSAFWDTVTSGCSAIRPISTFDASPFRSRIAAECDFDPVRAGLSAQQIRRLDRAAQFAVVAAKEAVADADLVVEPKLAARVGVSIGTAVGSTIRLEEEYLVLSDEGRRWLVDPRYAVPHLYDFFVPSSFAAEVAWLVGAEGPATVVSAGCTSGLDAVGHAYHLIGDGEADVVIAGGTDAPISPITVACFDAIRATSPDNDRPRQALRPFDRSRSGFVLGEGAAVLVLEERERALSRGARVHAEIAGFANRNNAYHMTGLRADGREMAAAISAAIGQAGLAPADVDYVNAHGTGTKQNDRHETAAIKHALGAHAYEVPVSSIKPIVGHSLGAIGAIEVLASALALQTGVVPPTANLTEPDPELDLDYVPIEARSCPMSAVLCLGSGFGGFQTAMALTHPEREERR